MKNSFLYFFSNFNPLYLETKERVIQLENFLLHNQNDFEKEIKLLREKISELEAEGGGTIAEQKQAEIDRLQGLLNDLVGLLGEEDIKNISDVQALLNDQTLADLAKTKEMFSEKISNLEDQMMNLARQKIKLNKSSQEKLNSLLEKHQKEKEELQTEQEREREETKEQITGYHEKIAHLERDLKTARDLLKNKETKDNLEEYRNYLNSSYLFLQQIGGWLGDIANEARKADSADNYTDIKREAVSANDKFIFFFTAQIRTEFETLLRKEELWNREAPMPKKKKKKRK